MFAEQGDTGSTSGSVNNARKAQGQNYPNKPYTAEEWKSQNLRPRMNASDLKVLSNGGDVSGVDNRSGMEIKYSITRANTQHENFSMEKRSLIKTEVDPKSVVIPAGGFSSFEYSEYVTVELQTVVKSQNGTTVVNAAPYTIKEGKLGRLEVVFADRNRRAIELRRAHIQPEDVPANVLSLINKVQQFEGQIYYTIKSGDHIVVQDKILQGELALETIPELYVFTIFFKREKDTEWIGNLGVKFDAMTSFIMVFSQDGQPYTVIIDKRPAEFDTR
jgi:hypothetical protein